MVQFVMAKPSFVFILTKWIIKDLWGFAFFFYEISGLELVLQVKPAVRPILAAGNSLILVDECLPEPDTEILEPAAEGVLDLEVEFLDVRRGVDAAVRRVEIAVEKYNEKYSALSESDRELIKLLIKATPQEKKDLFEEYKVENLQMLNSLNEEKNSEKVEKTINKINEMVFNEETIDDDLIDLHELKQGLS